MKVQHRDVDLTSLSAEQARYVTPKQLFLTVGSTYVVHAVSVYDKIAFVLIEDDLKTPGFRPAFLFDVVDTAIPNDWSCNLFPQGLVQLILGPSFIAQDLNSYDAMIDLRMASQEQLWHRINSRADDCDDDKPDQ